MELKPRSLRCQDGALRVFDPKLAEEIPLTRGEHRLFRTTYQIIKPTGWWGFGTTTETAHRYILVHAPHGGEEYNSYEVSKSNALDKFLALGDVSQAHLWFDIEYA